MKRELELLTILRGLAALWVVFYHIADRLAPYLGSSVVGYIHQGYLAVDFFFVLSGFVIALNYQKHFESFKTSIFKEFIIKRIARIYPLHLLILCCYLIIPFLYWVTNRAFNIEVTNFVTHLFLVNNWFIFANMSWNVPAWSISAEFFAYLLFPLIAIYFNKHKSLLSLVLTYIVLNIIIIIWFSCQNVVSIGVDIPQNGLIRCIIQFSLGVVVYNLINNYQNRLTAITLNLILFVLISLFLNVSNYFFIPTLMVLLLLLAIKIEHTYQFTYPNILIWLGNISYSTYLCHYLVKDLLKLILPDNNITPIWWIAAYLIITISVSHITYHYVEIKSKGWLLRRYYQFNKL